MVVLIGVATFILRAIHLDRSWDIFVDEISYLRLSQSVAENLEVKLYGNPLYLHPPLFFFIEGAYTKLLSSTGDLIQQIYDVRYLNVALAGLTAVVLFGIGRRLAGWLVGATTATIFALEPFVIKMNSRNYLDTSAMLWVVLGYYVLFSAMTDENRRLPLWRVLAAGVLFGLALLTKDITAFATLLPLAVCFVMNWAMPRLQSALAGVVAALVYAPYLIVIYAIGDWRDFSYQKLQGASRLAGLLHETGFNQEGGPSFLMAIISNLEEFATTYALLATGSLSVVVLFFFARGAAKRLLLAWTASTYALLAYIVVLGTLEEQFFYYLIISSILSTVVTAKLILGTEAFGDHVRRVLLAATVLLTVAFFSWTSYIWAQVHSTPDDGYERVVAYIEENVPKDSKVAVVPDTAEFLIKGSSGKYGSVEELQRNDVDYVVYGSYVLKEGYGKAPPEFYRWIVDNGELVYGFEGPSFGLLGVYRLPDRPTFTHRATAETILNNSTYIDDPLINGDPDAVLSVTPNWNPGGKGGTYDDHPVGVWYDAIAQRWAVFNQDLARMPEGAAFNVEVLPPSESVFTHRATSGNISGNWTYIYHPSANDNPDAVLSVTPNWNPGSEGGTYNDHPIGVWYDANAQRWAIFNQDLARMPEGAAFNVEVLDSSDSSESVFIHRATADTISNDSTYIDDPLTNGDPDTVLSATPNWNPGGEGGTYDDHPVGVWYDASRQRWAVFNQDLARMPEGAAFNVRRGEQ
ncbi:MAG: ArnT family glycosyltransferase [Rubrobacteraceae bacterium]